VKNYSKAIAGFVAAAIVAFLGATDGGVTAQEWLQVLLAGIGGSGLVYAFPKNKPSGRHNQAGYADVGLALLVVAVIGIVLLLFGVRFGGN